MPADNEQTKANRAHYLLVCLATALEKSESHQDKSLSALIRHDLACHCDVFNASNLRFRKAADNLLLLSYSKRNGQTEEVAVTLKEDGLVEENIGRDLFYQVPWRDRPASALIDRASEFANDALGRHSPFADTEVGRVLFALSRGGGEQTSLRTRYISLKTCEPEEAREVTRAARPSF
jgi:hypothetical protein